LRFLSVVVPFFDKMVNCKTIVFLKQNVNFLLTGTVGFGVVQLRRIKQ